MKKFWLLFIPMIALADIQQVAIDEQGNFLPAAASNALATAVSASIRVDLQQATAEGILQVAESSTNALAVLEEALAHRTDYALVQLCATGLEDATGELAEDGGSINFIEDKTAGYQITIDKTTDPNFILVTLYYCFTGNLTTPYIRAKSNLSGDWLEDVTQSAPELIHWGDQVIYRTVVSVPKAWNTQAFFQVTANIRTAVDDGKVFDIFSDSGVTGTFRVTPASTIIFRLQAGRIISMQGTGIQQEQ